MTTAVRKGLLIKADPIAAQFRDEVKQALAQLSCRPKLVGILATTSAPSKSYAEFTRKQCEELGFEFVLKTTGAAASPELGEGDGVEEAIIEANEDKSIHGIMVRGEILTSIHLFTCPPIIFKGLFPYFWCPTGWLNKSLPTLPNLTPANIGSLSTAGSAYAIYQLALLFNSMFTYRWSHLSRTSRVYISNSTTIYTISV